MQNFTGKRLKAKEHCSYSLQSTPKSRPTGVTIIAILNIIGGIIMLFGAIALIAIGAILPTLPPIVFNQSELQANLTAGQAPTIPPSWCLSYGFSVSSWRDRHCIWHRTSCYIYSFICRSLWATQRSRMGVDRYCGLVNYQYSIQCNFSCYRKYSRNYQHYHKWNNPILSIQTTCQSLFWQRSKSIPHCLAYH